MRISEVAKQAGTSIQALRYYERQGFLGRPARAESGYRTYSNVDLERLRFLKRCQALGFTLKEIKQLSAIHGDRPDARQRREFLLIASKRLAFLDAKIGEYQCLRAQVNRLIQQAAVTPMSQCPAQAQQNNCK
ncbi:MAG TPA: MerR family transcriptional regulator [Terriglobales bacterium]|nr:MerR family transcriptional regulator [Terriglobales bacterium]